MAVAEAGILVNADAASQHSPEQVPWRTLLCFPEAPGTDLVESEVLEAVVASFHALVTAVTSYKDLKMISMNYLPETFIRKSRSKF